LLLLLGRLGGAGSLRDVDALHAPNICRDRTHTNNGPSPAPRLGFAGLW
jgi:hypothetical protein